MSAAEELAPDLSQDPAFTLVRDHLWLADRLALRYAGRGQAYEDLQQVAYLGLVLAAGRFDPDRGVAFATFAQATILGELKRHFRDFAWTMRVARPVQETFLAVRAAREELTRDTGRSPTPAELAARLGITVEQVVESLDAGATLHLDSLDAPVDDEEGTGRRDVAFEEDGFDRAEERTWLVPALSRLPERERTILKLRFFDGLAQSAIAARLGISQMHVSRLLARSLAALRAAAPYD
ncbi:MAG TPA: sigma-70 family RNA polymerase sigma factor [Mycobacteriales bacterium]